MAETFPQQNELSMADDPRATGASDADAFDSARPTRRQVLVVEDSELNREMLCAILEDEFDVVCAENGEVGLQKLEALCDTLSAVLLDVYMPVCDGFEFLRRSQGVPNLAQVPVIVATGSSSSEEEIKCLDLGASDFVIKPYNARVVMSRLKSVIRLRESSRALAEVERDDQTGAFTRQAFLMRASMLAAQHAPEPTHIITAKIEHFNSVCAALGRADSDRMLSYLGERYRGLYPDVLMGRVEPDCFACIVQLKALPWDRLRARLEEIEQNLPFSGISIIYGAYENVARDLSAEEAIDRAMAALDAANFDGRITIARFDGPVSRRVIQEQAMAASFDEALADGQFRPWYQPKVDTRTGELRAAEALVRWIRPDGTMISPGVFIPLFERDGLVSRLDEYIFGCVCRFQCDRREAGKPVVPISVNLSRTSLLSHGVVERYVSIAEKLDVPLSLVPLEVTESMGIEDELLLERVRHLHDAGFPVHLDDFGSGYSSLATLTTLPLDVVKIDKTLMDRSGTRKGDQLIRFTAGLVHVLGMGCVAEGVETQEQVELLRETRCGLIQGYVYSAPKPQDDFAAMLDSHKNFA